MPALPYELRFLLALKGRNSALPLSVLASCLLASDQTEPAAVAGLVCPADRLTVAWPAVRHMTFDLVGASCFGLVMVI